MALPPFRPLATTLDERRVDIDRVEQMAGGVFRVAGFVIIQEPGELLVPVKFPIRFMEKPSFSFGGEVAPNSPVQAGKYPTLSVLVRNWQFEIQPQTGARWYVGATLLSVSTGIDGQTMEVHYQLEGRGLRGPS
jgi:hypothetical protein